jgi:hypothetical protein
LTVFADPGGFAAWSGVEIFFDKDLTAERAVGLTVLSLRGRVSPGVSI